MSKKIRFEITKEGDIHAKTIGMDDYTCLDYIEVFESILEAKAIDSDYTEEFIKAQNIQNEEANINIETKIEIKGE